MSPTKPWKEDEEGKEEGTPKSEDREARGRSEKHGRRKQEVEARGVYGR